MHKPAASGYIGPSVLSMFTCLAIPSNLVLGVKFPILGTVPAIYVHRCLQYSLL